MPQLPSVLVSEASGGKVRASAALRLIEITPLATNKKGAADVLSEHREAVSFLRAAGQWAGSTLELRYLYYPNLAHPTAGNTQVFVVLHEVSGEPNVRRDVLARMKFLAPLLKSRFRSTVFEPVTTEAELAGILRPEAKGRGWALTRNRARLTLQDGEITSAAPIGFGAVNDRKPKPPAVADNAFDYVFPWVPSHDTWRAIAETLHEQAVPSYLTIRVRAAREIDAALEKGRAQLQACEDYLRSKPSDTMLAERTQQFRQALLIRQADLRECALDVTVTLTSSVAVDKAVAATVGEAFTGGVVGLSDVKIERLSLLSGGYDVTPVRFEDAMNPEFHIDEHPFSASEAACAFRFPYPTASATQNLPVKLYRTNTADVPSPQPGDLILGRNVHQGGSQIVGIPTVDRLRHMYVIGVTGSGKSTLLESLILQDIYAGRGVAFVDPHGETVDRILGKIPKERIQDVMLIDPLDYERPVGFNLLRCASDFERDYFIGELWETFDRAYDMRQTGGPIFEQYLRIFLRILMGDDGFRETRAHVPTIVDFEMAMSDDSARRRLMQGCDEPVVKAVLKSLQRVRGEASLENIVPYITSKFSRFIYDKAMARIVGQSRNEVDFARILRERKIVFFKLGKGRFAAQVCDVLAGSFVARLLSATFARSDVPADERTDYFLYVDEFQNLVSEAFGEMLAEVRKYRLGLTLAHQYTDQLQRDNRTNLLPAVLGNVGSIVSFRVGATDAERLAPSLKPVYTEDDLLNLPNYQAYVRTNLGGRFVQPFNLVTDVPNVKYSAKTAAAVRDYSRMTYGRSVKEIDEELKARRDWLLAAMPPEEKPVSEINLEDLFS